MSTRYDGRQADELRPFSFTRDFKLDDPGVTRILTEGARTAFLEDLVVLEAQQRARRLLSATAARVLKWRQAATVAASCAPTARSLLQFVVRDEW